VERRGKAGPGKRAHCSPRVDCQGNRFQEATGSEFLSDCISLQRRIKVACTTLNITSTGSQDI
jgi:hypothetical protein